MKIYNSTYAFKHDYYSYICHSEVKIRDITAHWYDDNTRKSDLAEMKAYAKYN